MPDFIPNHIPVLFNEVLEYAQVDEGDLWVDCTLGRGGHTLGLLKAGARVLAFDQDLQAITETSQRLKSYLDQGQLTIIHQNFRFLTSALEENGISEVAGILADLGVSSPQLDEAERGFSFMASGPLDMRMNQNKGLSASEWLNQHSETELCHILRKYGEEPRARFLANKVKHWSEEGGGNTLDLARLIENLTPMKLRRKLNKHPATRVFQALRIAVNDELGSLEDLLHDGPELLGLNGKCLFISFHSLEDRLVKQRFKFLSEPPPPPRRGLPPPTHEPPAFSHLPRKGVVADPKEIESNPRSRSARLRMLTRIRLKS